MIQIHPNFRIFWWRQSWEKIPVDLLHLESDCRQKCKF